MNASFDKRPDPDTLLKALAVEEKRKSKGALKIFLGMAPGVGKTYAMLKAAHDLKNKGIDVVIGIVESHGRKGIAELSQGLEAIPRKEISYRGKVLEEFDLDQVYERRPKIILIDELAHTNAPGTRNNKRFLDVEEILNHGIDVFTTVNVQHLESRAQSVQEITGIEIRETVPDYFLELADEIIVIDLPPEDLLKRLDEGLVYGKERSELAKSHFFKKGNLTALRELTLRIAAERVDRDLRTYRQEKNIQEIWKSGHRLLVGIFASPYSENLIRATKRLAGTLDASWIGLYVETDKELSENEKTLLVKNIELVRELGGELITTKADDTVSGILRIASQENVTQINIGKTRRSWLRNILSGGSIENRLQRKSGNIDIYSVSSAKVRSFHTEQKFFRKENLDLIEESGWLSVVFIFTWILASLLNPFLGYLAIGFVFLISVSIAGLFFSRVSVFSLAILFSLIHNYFFIPPIFTFSIRRPEDIFMNIMFVITAAIIGQLTSRLKIKEQTLSNREDRALTLYHLTKELLKAKGLQDIVNIGSKFVESTLQLDCLILVKDVQNSFTSGSFSEVMTNDKEKAVAYWALSNAKHAGRFTRTLSDSSGYYLPLTGNLGTVGVLALKVNDLNSFEPDQMTLLENFANHLVSALDREIVLSRTKNIELYEETQKLYKTLLECVSHELKTPLAAIKGCSSTILDKKVRSNEKLVADLAQEILLGSDRLQRIVDNLLDMSRIESGMLKPKIVTYSVTDLIEGAISKLSSELRTRSILIHQIDKKLTVKCDPLLTEQVLINLLLNAHMYSPSDKPIEITCSKAEKFVPIQIRDFGKGLELNDLSKIFTKFYRAHPEKTGGIGLGLVIVKNIVELEGGHVGAQNHPEGGAVFSIELPLGDEDV